MKKIKKCICTSGLTIDDRIVKPSFLHDIAKNFNLKDYQPTINVEHFTKIGGFKEQNLSISNYGLVDNVDIVEENGKTKLYADISLNKYGQKLIEENQKLFTSIEARKIGDYWIMTALALTDNPASFGTDRLDLTKKDKNVEFLSADCLINLDENKKIPENQRSSDSELKEQNILLKEQKENFKKLIILEKELMLLKDENVIFKKSFLEQKKKITSLNNIVDEYLNQSQDKNIDFNKTEIKNPPLAM